MPDERGRLSLREAAEAFAVSRPTLSKALTAGRLSGERDAAGAWRIEVSELARVYAPRRGPEPPEAAPDALADALAEAAELRAALALERARRESAERLAEERAAHLADLRRLLPGPETPRRRWWPFRP